MELFFQIFINSSTGVSVSKTGLSRQSESEMSKTLNSSVTLFMSTKS